MNELVAFLTAMIALSVGVERIVEIIKQFIPFLQADPKDAALAPRRRWMLQILAAASGTGVVVAIGPNHFLPKFETVNGSVAHYGVSALLGLMSSGGSAFWNHALDIVGAVKTVKEGEVKNMKAGTA